MTRSMLDVVRLTRQLIDIPSVTDHEREVGEFLESTLSELGFSTRRQELSEARFNLFATHGTRPRVVLCSHIDTVPPFFASYEDEEFVYGRGACDTKGIIAAMVCAGESLLSDGVTDFGYLLVVGEETDSIGAKRANDEFAAEGIEFTIVGEPTESVFVSATKGAMTCTVRFEGVAAHSAYPERGDSAILKMLRGIEDLGRTSWGEDSILGKGTLNVGVVRGGEKANIIPAIAEADMILRIVEPLEQVKARVEEVVSRHGGSIIRWYGNDPMHMMVPAGHAATVASFNTDVPHLRKLGKPLLFGPGSILDAHSGTEKISKQELKTAIATYASLVRDLLAGKVRPVAETV